MRTYLVIFERSENNWAAYAPDVPGCIATAPTKEEVSKLFSEALQFHIQGLEAAGLPVPPPTSEASELYSSINTPWQSRRFRRRRFQKRMGEDVQLIAAKFALGELPAAGMRRFAERELTINPDNAFWLAVLVIGSDTAADLVAVFKAALDAHGIPVPDPEEAVACIASLYAQETIQLGLKPVEAATYIVSRFRFGEGPTLPSEVYNLEGLLAQYSACRPDHQSLVAGQINEEIRRLAHG